ncbi:orotidine-5'-phosphate decarboxylase [Nonomuraea phyllanthi]|uniref:Orotidine-5'-phosphate decarboxylase n=1 Tax=Nonomuraea phyllanthi TaxID=2219224 RepID=A0A5C4WCR3_9ACTN|nr:orotidine-5'-phosphate decarboxylase [Nonomuraea phyllanthi]KAB8193165.1 orotidine-5'-phosphate decarboxylase [Nonomuraea phyllanthi]QFY10973.1 orotidine-5'-phosphate decarboxylase [Nonomuraea phyllanthi]
MNESFGTRLRGRLDKYGPLCVGIDPSPALLHAWGLDDSPAGLESFSRTVVDAVSDVAAVVKPQSAFFERWGSRGIAVLERTIADLRDAGTLVLLDIKRGDIDSTMAAYAEAYLDRGSPLAADAVTLSPYLGFGSLEGAILSAVANDAGVFVLARTSNPEAAPLQRPVAGQVLAGAAAANAGHAPFGPVGVVMGATLPASDDALTALTDLNGPILAPGLGAQGATPADVARVFGPVRHAVVPSVSRAVLADPGRLRARVLHYRDECVAHLTAEIATQS